MISYEPFYNTLREQGVSEYSLIFKRGISANTIHRMKHGESSLQRRSILYVKSWIAESQTSSNM